MVLDIDVENIVSMTANYTFIKGSSPIVFTAIHDGHRTRDELEELFNLNESQRLREEDPYTALWLKSSDNRIIVHHSRFETDVNRSRDKAVYRVPEDAWGLKVWNKELPEEVVEHSLQIYDNFYRQCRTFFDDLFRLHKRIVVYDIHTYNYRREDTGKEADPSDNPEINLGTKNMDRALWHNVIDCLINHFSNFDYNGRNLDTRENIKFKGGYFGQWLHEQYGQNI